MSDVITEGYRYVIRKCSLALR